MKFAHLGDCHLGGWRQPELVELNFRSFQIAIDVCIKEKVDFILIAGDLFDSAYPPIEVIKDTFAVFKKIKESKIPVFLIAGSHDYSASGKTFLDVLEKAGFCENAFKPEKKDGQITLRPIIYRDVAIYGYPGKKSGLEVPEIEKVKLQDAPGFFKILMLHTTLRDAIGNLPIAAVNHTNLPKADYTALAHLHIKYNKDNRIYCGPTFPNNSLELEELKGGSFYISDTSGKAERREIMLKEILVLNIELTNALMATEKILEELRKHSLKDKIIILKLSGVLETGRTSNINLKKIEDYTMAEGAYVLLKNTNKLHTKETEIKLELDSENIEEEIIKKFQEENKSRYDDLIHPLISVLQADKKEDEKSQIFEERLLSEAGKVIGI